MTSDAGRTIRNESWFGLRCWIRALAVVRASVVDGRRGQGGHLRGTSPAAGGGGCYTASTPLWAILKDLDGKDEHHETGVKWDNRPSNIEAIDHGEHAAMHAETPAPDSGEDLEVPADD